MTVDFEPLRKAWDNCEFCGRDWEQVMRDKRLREEEEEEALLKKTSSMMKGEATEEDRKGIWDHLKSLYRKL